MDDRLLVEALRSRDPGALGDVYDVYAERLYGYCWFRLRCRDTAQVALRDTFIVAEAHIDKLRDYRDFASWLYAIARMECTRGLPLPGRGPDVQVASHDQEDVDQRVLAWRSVTGLDPLSQELLDLTERHGLGPAQIAAVLGLPVKAVPELFDQAREELDAALAAELLAHEGPYDCAGRTALLQERRGELTPELRARLLRHARECQTCGGVIGAPDPAGRVRPMASPAKVYGLLPAVEPPDSLRWRVLGCFSDPELVSYRLFVATRQGNWQADGFPERPRLRLGWLTPDTGETATGHARPTVKALTVVTAVILGLGAAGAGAERLTSDQPRGARIAASGDRQPSASPQPPVSTPTVSSRAAAGGDRTGAGTAPISPTFPLGATGSAAPRMALPSPPRRVHQYGPDSPAGAAGPGTLSVSAFFLDVGTGSTGTVRLQAQGGPLTWLTSVSGPLRLSRSGGWLAAGQSITLGVMVFRAPASHGSATITFQPGGQQLTVTWREQPPSSPPPSGPPTGPPSHRPPPPPSPPGRSSPPASPSPAACQSPSAAPDPAPAPPAKQAHSSAVQPPASRSATAKG